MQDSLRLLFWVSLNAVALLGDGRVVSDNNTYARVRRAISICTVIARLHSDIRAAMQQQHIPSGPRGELELLLFSTAAAIISAND